LMERARFLPRYRSLAERHRLLERRGAPGWDAFVLVKEALHLSLCPSGCLSPLYGVPVRDHAGDAAWARGAGYPRRAGLLELISLVLPLVREYLDSDRPVDDALLASGIAAFEANPHTLG
ncbi:MAG: hypothetical protein M3442_04035, partial [Chloroflexota bacterium]|nr:hypothetical protein [Chloroflexota bacterium]